MGIDWSGVATLDAVRMETKRNWHSALTDSAQVGLGGASGATGWLAAGISLEGDDSD